MPLPPKTICRLSVYEEFDLFNDTETTNTVFRQRAGWHYFTRNADKLCWPDTSHLVTLEVNGYAEEAARMRGCLGLNY